MGRKINFTNSKTFGVATDRNASVTLDLPECTLKKKREINEKKRKFFLKGEVHQKK